MLTSEDRVRAILTRACRSAAPPPSENVWEWSERNRVLGSSSRLAGPYRTNHTPFWRDVMADMSPRSPVERVIVQKAAQVGCTELALNCIAYYLAAVPAPVLYVAPTILTATRFSRQRLSEAIALSPVLRELMSTPRGGE